MIKDFKTKEKKPFFFYRGFISQTLMIQGAGIIPLYHFHPLANMRQLFAT